METQQINKAVKKGIAFKPVVYKTLEAYSEEFSKGNMSLAVNTILERALAKFEIAPLCPTHRQRMWRGKHRFYCVAKDCTQSESFRLRA